MHEMKVAVYQCVTRMQVSGALHLSDIKLTGVFSNKGRFQPGSIRTCWGSFLQRSPLLRQFWLDFSSMKYVSVSCTSAPHGEYAIKSSLCGDDATLGQITMATC